MGKVIGIDLGTTNSCVSVVEGGNPVVIPSAEGGRTTPSIVAFTKDGDRLVGIQAKNQMITNPANTIRSIKRFMGRRFEEVQNEISMVPYKIVQGPNGDCRINTDYGDFSAPEISARILQKMASSASDYLGQKVTEAVVTVPAYFNMAQKEATKDAGKIAGLDVRRIINEPTAAALAYGLDKANKKGKIAVYDLGGGTFDISILELGEGVFEVKATNGDTHLGGDDFDQVVILWMVDEFKMQTGIDLKQDPMAMQRLKDAAEKAKIELSGAQNTEINLPFVTADSSGPKHLNLSLSRSKFEQMITPLVERTRQPFLNCISDAKMSAGEIDEVILVGGSTRIPLVQKLVSEIFGKEPNRQVNPDEAVAMGAAVQGAVLAGEVNDILLLDVIPLSMGIETLGGVFTKMIERNTTIPTRRTEVFSTADDNQPSVSIMVYQGERAMARENRLMGQFNLDGIPPAPRGVPQIEVTFDIDANGILHVSAKDLSTQKAQSIRIEASSGLSDDEINNMVKDAETHAEQDKQRKDEAEVKNKADTLAYTTERTIKELGDKIKPDDKVKLEAGVEELKKAINSNDINGMKTAMDKLQADMHKITTELYQQAGGAAQGGPGGPGGFSDAQQQQQSGGTAGSDDDVVDAEYSVSDEDKK